VLYYPNFSQHFEIMGCIINLKHTDVQHARLNTSNFVSFLFQRHKR
jgi:hypothetical protein